MPNSGTITKPTAFKPLSHPYQEIQQGVFASVPVIQPSNLDRQKRPDNNQLDLECNRPPITDDVLPNNTATRP